MDPQSQAFTPVNSISEPWRLQADLTRVQQVQAEHAERLARLERKQDEDARVKSVWGSQSPFPSVLSGTPQQAPLQQPPSDHFRTFDADPANLMSSLHLDAEDEPRRGMGAASRANSVRFDETANQNHFTHSSRPSTDFISRSNSGFGALQMNERSSSHKSDGRASSVHSIRSAASGRANSLNLDSTYNAQDTTRSPLDTPSIAPGLLLLGAVPAIVRCWMNTNFKHDALLYAAICTGSYASYLDLRLIEKLGFEEHIHTNERGHRCVNLPIFFPEAVPFPASSRSSSPVPQLPSLVVEFQVVHDAHTDREGKSIQIFLGSDVLREHHADILFSSNSITLYDDDSKKVSIPLARPEHEAAFNTLYITTGPSPSLDASQSLQSSDLSKSGVLSNGIELTSEAPSTISSTTASPPPGRYRPPGIIAAESVVDSVRPIAPPADLDTRPSSRLSTSSRPSLTLYNTRTERDDGLNEAEPQSSTSTRTGNSPAIWSNWRRDGNGSTPTPTTSTAAASSDWAASTRSRDATYQRKETGIKVLKPKLATRAFSSTMAAPSPTPTTPANTAFPSATLPGAMNPADGKSRFFDEGRRRSTALEDSSMNAARSTDGKKEIMPPGLAGSSVLPTDASANATPVKTKANPIGGASAFSWLSNPGTK